MSACQLEEDGSPLWRIPLAKPVFADLMLLGAAWLLCLPVHGQLLAFRVRNPGIIQVITRALLRRKRARGRASPTWAAPSSPAP